MISKNKIKLIRSLNNKKQRDVHKLFIAEGSKVVSELMHSFLPKILITTDETIAHQPDANKCDVSVVSATELKSISLLQHPQDVIAVFEKPSHDDSLYLDSLIDDKLYLALDGVQDPGNLGTIIRIADWFGISDIICSINTVDVYNPKVVQATMGSLARVNVTYTDLPAFLSRMQKRMPIYGTLLNGTNIYKQQLSHTGIIIMGNEGNGITPLVTPYIDTPLLIPSFQTNENQPDSLNVAVATAIVCSEFCRGK